MTAAKASDYREFTRDESGQLLDRVILSKRDGRKARVWSIGKNSMVHTWTLTKPFAVQIVSLRDIKSLFTFEDGSPVGVKL